VAVQFDFGKFLSCLSIALEVAVRRLAKTIERVWYDGGTPYVAWRFRATWQALRLSAKLPVVKAGEIKGKIGPPFIQPDTKTRILSQSRKSEP